MREWLPKQVRENGCHVSNQVFPSPHSSHTDFTAIIFKTLGNSRYGKLGEIPGDLQMYHDAMGKNGENPFLKALTSWQITHVEDINKKVA